MENLQKDFVPYESALRIKQLGYDEPCFAFYQIEYNEDIPVMVDDDNQYRISGFRTCKNSEIPAHYTTTPTWQSAFRWFREKYDLHHVIHHFTHKKGTDEEYLAEVGKADDIFSECRTYEEAELACLEKLLEIVEEKQK
jgi:hypothetical protein